MARVKTRINFGKNEIGDTVGYSGDAHIMTIAPTGAGKGRSSIIPNLLSWPGSVLVIDPKGENAERTYRRRQALNETVHVLDPFVIARCRARGRPLPCSAFNPLEFISLGPEGITQADRLADTLVVAEKGSNRFFSDEARVLLRALILHVRSACAKQDRHLGTVNRLAAAGDTLFAGDAPCGGMLENYAYGELVCRLAGRMRSKQELAEREFSAVLSTVQSNLSHFLDDPRIEANLAHSDFSFRALKDERMSVFIVLPAQYLETFGRWLRLLVATALDQLLEDMSEESRPAHDVLFVLDEFAHLGHLEAVKTAYGIGRGAGVKLWAFLQNLGQLDEHYGEHGRETFLANSGAVEVFNMNDNQGLKYFSERIGEEYVVVDKRQVSTSQNMPGHAPAQVSEGISETSSREHERRPIVMPRQIAALHPDKKLLFRQGYEFEILDKVYYDQNPKLSPLTGC